MPLWDITEEFFSTVGYNGEGFPPLWDTTEEDIFRCGIQQRKISGWQTIFFYCIPQRWKFFHSLYPTPQQNLMQCTVSQKNLQHCIPQCRRVFFRCIPYRRYFPPLWDTTEEVFFVVGYNGKKLYCTTQNYIFKF